jgi:hypothetical protein
MPIAKLLTAKHYPIPIPNGPKGKNAPPTVGEHVIMIANVAARDQQASAGPALRAD